MKLGTVVKTAIPLAIVAAIGLYFYSSMKPVAVVAEVVRDVAVKAVPGTVIVRPDKDMQIKSEIAGRVTLSNLEEGEEVSVGDILIQLDAGDLELKIERATIELDVANSRLEQGSALKFDLISAKEHLKDVERNLELGTASSSRVQDAKRNVEKIVDQLAAERLQYELTVKGKSNELKALQRQLEKMTILSPIDGIVAEVFTSEGDLVRQSQEMARVVSHRRIVEAKISEDNFAGIEIGMKAAVRFLGMGREVSGAVNRIIPVPDENTQRYTIHLDLGISDEELSTVLTGDALITLHQRESALLVPLRALQGTNVLAVKKGVVSIEKIRKGYATRTFVEILEGVDEGDLVIVERHELFNDGDRVRVGLQ